MGVWLKPTFHATPLPLCHETSVCTLEESALIRGSLPRPWGEGGRRPGEGQPTRIAPQNVQTLGIGESPMLLWRKKMRAKGDEDATRDLSWSDFFRNYRLALPSNSEGAQARRSRSLSANPGWLAR